MNVIKADGSSEKLDVRKIKKQTKYACKGIKGITPEDIELGAQINFYDCISTKDIQKSLINAAKSMIDVDKPQASFVAARLYMYDMYHSYLSLRKDLSLKTYIEEGVREGILNPMLLSFDIPKYEKLVKCSDGKIFDTDYLFNYAAIVNIDVKILEHDKDGKVLELPSLALITNSMMLSTAESNIDDGYLFVKNHYELTSNQYMMTSTPTLGNARKPRPQLSSCYIGATNDNVEGITESYAEIAILSKFGGGIGWDWNEIRANSSEVDGHSGASGGVTPFLKILNDVGLAFDQLGCVSRDAEVLVLDSVTYRSKKIDYSNGIGILKHIDEHEKLSVESSNVMYDTDVEDMNKASLSISCLFI